MKRTEPKSNIGTVKGIETKLSTDFSVRIQPASRKIMADGEEYHCHLMGDSMEIRRVRDDKS